VDLDTPFRDLLSRIGLDLYDVELAGGALNVTVTRPDGVDLEALTEANHLLSAWLDEHDPLPGRYTLDVSSPGLERRLRTPAHFLSAIGDTVTLRERRDGEATRRLEGPLTSASSSELTIDDHEAGTVTVALSTIERARTVFAWGATAKPSPSKGRASTAGASRRK
jgi:ribosome maturation factor RimP